MSDNKQVIQRLLSHIRSLRQAAKLTEAELEEKLILGPGWISSIEAGRFVPSLDLLLSILHTLGKKPADVFQVIDNLQTGSDVERHIYAMQEGNALGIHFHYSMYDAKYGLPSATISQFEEVIKTLRNGLSRLVNSEEEQSEALKSDSVAKSYLKAVELWPNANPSDLWWFVIYRAYCDPFNHPAKFARLDFQQSWKRTGGWALEEVLVRHYVDFLKKHGINISIAPADIKQEYIEQLKLKDRLEADKVDVILTGNVAGEERFFGVVHVKASFAERRTDDVPMSRVLVNAGYTSPLWTMDCKSTPSEIPNNKGELGEALSSEGKDERSAKRKDIEDDGYFSACFSYNTNTIPTAEEQKAKARIHVCDFKNPDDTFSKFVISEWKRVRDCQKRTNQRRR